MNIDVTGVYIRLRRSMFQIDIASNAVRVYQERQSGLLTVCSSSPIVLFPYIFPGIRIVFV